ncbi:DUF3955 domain-containing protein [Virgibacillus sp. Bac330]|uniref:DUF3955 domain-containing protein n=1 Tax=Virgibacillus sp. Bac330 TaxID=2419841 RepID=UPI000EF478A5|nr:DUF3955 domain-containing protein [Virgibacillus sp. Bac330]
MKKKMILASSPILLGVICLMSYYIIGARVTEDGVLKEPFFLIPLSFLFIFSGITLLCLMALVAVIKNRN